MIRVKKLPKTEILNSILNYCPESGALYWKKRLPSMFHGSRKRSDIHICASWNSRYAGREAFTSLDISGYRRGSINGTHYVAHRIIWKMVYGVDPEFIDHIDGDKTNNRIQNLRSVSIEENSKNLRKSPDREFSTFGVYAHKSGWRATIKANGKCRHLGVFVTEEDAITARKTAEKKYKFHRNHGQLLHRLALTIAPELKGE